MTQDKEKIWPVVCTCSSGAGNERLGDTDGDVNVLVSNIQTSNIFFNVANRKLIYQREDKTRPTCHWGYSIQALRDCKILPW